MKSIYQCAKCGAYTEEAEHCGTAAKLVLDGGTRLRISKLLALSLRHNPSVLGLDLDKDGWAEVEAVVRGLEKYGYKISAEILAALITLDDKGRYEMKNGRVRARYGHTIHVEIEYPVDEVIRVLYHGTSLDNLPSIMSLGVLPMKRMYVHLAADLETACLNAKRKPRPVVLEIDADCVREEVPIYRATQKILLTRYVPARCVKKLVIC
ncbi:MAG: RNA 2'-phosphotransferase [Pyrobaculum sp.]